MPTAGALLAAIALLLPTVAAWGLPEPVTVDLWSGLKDGIIGTDPDAGGGRCVVANVTKMSGTAFEADTPPLEPGVYDAVLRLKLPMINNMNTAPLNWTLRVTRAGAGARAFNMLRIEAPNVYQDIPCRFTVARAGKARVSLSWKREALSPDGKAEMRVEQKDIPTEVQIDMPTDDDDGADEDFDLLELEAEIEAEPPLGGLRYLYTATDAVTIVPVADVAISRLEVDKIRYRPGEQATVAIAVRNYGAGPRELKVETVFIQDLDTVIPVDARTLSVGRGQEQAFEVKAPPFEKKWGYAVRCRVLEGAEERAAAEDYFTVHDNMWAVLMAGSGAAQFSAHITRERAIAAAQRNKRRYRNWVESGFWAPDEFGDFTPDTEHWWGGQGCYYGGVTGTKVHIEEGHKVGISYAVYSNIWGGDGPPAFEMVRRRPDWGYASTFNVEWLDNWDRNPMGTGSDKRPMHVWPLTIMNNGATDEPIRHHGRELIETHRMFGWDAVRYDSHAISDENARLLNILRPFVHAEEPDFQFGYNCSVPRRDPAMDEAFKVHCEGECLIMEEGIRQYGGGGMSFTGGKTYEEFARRILEFKQEAREYGGHFVAIGMDKCYPNDLVYQYIFWFAGNTHICYDWQDVSVANYTQFATRFAGQLWDLNVTTIAEPANWLDVGPAADHLWLWKDYVHQRDLGDGRRQFIAHLINAPAEERLFTHDDLKVPPPRADIPLQLKLPEGAKVRGVWFLTPEYELAQQELAWKGPKNGAISFTVPRLRFWSTVVVDLENAGAFE